MTATQRTLFEAAGDTSLAQARAEAGMARASAHAGLSWQQRAYRAICQYASCHEFFHVDEFWVWAMDRGLDEGDSPRALGHQIQLAKKARILERTRISAASARSNNSPKPVWRSLTYQGPRTGRFRGGPVV